MGPLGGGCLLGVIALLVPVGGGEGQVDGGGEYGDDEVARAVGAVEKFLSCLAQSVGRPVVGADHGPVGAIECAGRGLYLSSQRMGSVQGGGVEEVAECCNFALSPVHITVRVREGGVCGSQRAFGLAPRMGRWRGQGGVWLRGEAFAQAVDRQVR